MSRADLTADRLRELLHYDPETGEFKWRVRVGPRFAAGSCAGGWANDGYVMICIKGVKHRANRLAWLYVHGTWPSGKLRHVNFLRYDTRMCNLELVA
jgi:hypothetical protein